jgi:hypothetical protein
LTIVRCSRREDVQYELARAVRDALLDVLPQIEDRFVLKAFPAKGFWWWEENVSRQQDLFHFEESADDGKDCRRFRQCGGSVCG